MTGDRWGIGRKKAPDGEFQITNYELQTKRYPRLVKRRGTRKDEGAEGAVEGSQPFIAEPKGSAGCAAPTVASAVGTVRFIVSTQDGPPSGPYPATFSGFRSPNYMGLSL